MRNAVAVLGLLQALFVSTPGLAQVMQPPLLTLEQAITLAETHNRRLEAADARLDVAEAGIGEARSQRRPRINLLSSLQRSNHPVMVFSNLLSQASFQAENFDLETLNHPDPLSNWQTALALEVPLWSGGRLIGGLESARSNRDATVAERERARQQVVREVTHAFATAVLAGHQLEVAQDALQSAAAHVALTRDLWQGGLAVESDVLRAQVRESEVRELLIRAESGVDLSHAALNLVLGRDLATAFTLPEKLAQQGQASRPEIATLTDRIHSAHQRRPDLQAAEQRSAAAEALIKVARAGKRPQVGLQANYESNADSFFGRDGDHWSVGVGFSLPLFDGSGTRARVAGARARAHEADVQVEMLRQEVGLEIRRAELELRAAHQRLEQAATGAALARRSLMMVEDRYKEGLTTLPELLDTETALTESRLREVAAQRDVLIARVDLELATGEL